MSEILTESFCERCGTRYTFESARSKIRLKGVKVLSRGLKNFVLSDDTTMDEAMAAARSETDREATAHQLDAFHKTFSFCMSCRQYTCPNCWNEVEARCQSCAPLPEPEFAAPEVLPPAFPGLVTLAGPATIAEPASNGANGHQELIGEGEPAPDVVASWDTAEGPADAWTVATDVATPEPEVPASQLSSPASGIEPAAKATSQTAGLLSRFRPGQNLDDELAAFERERTVAKPEPGETAGEAPVEPAIEVEPEPAEATQPEALTPESELATAESEAPAAEPEAAAVEPELVAAEPEPVAAEAEAPAAAEPPAQPAADVVEQPTWRITAPDLDAPSIGAPARSGEPAAAPIQATGPSLPSAEPQWPVRPEWPVPQASAGLPFLGRPAQPPGGVDSLWAASNRELVATPPAPGRTKSGIQPCISCGLSLSANARFCRRCGTLQGG
jgi:hypothetical protein